MKFLSSLSIAVVAVGSLATAAPGDGADLTAYIESIRASGMSENAQMQIRSVAGIACGASILKYVEDKESGRYWPSYTSATCPNPKADAPELTKWKKVKTDESAELVAQLQPFADADGSGFVTTEEGTQFRYLLEFGYMAAQAIEEHGPTIESVARANGTDIDATKERVREYVTMSARIREAGIQGLPELTVAGLAPKN